MADQILTSELRKLRLIVFEFVRDYEQHHALVSGKLEAFRGVLEIIDGRLKELEVTGMHEDWDLRR